VRELTTRAEAATVFVSYSLSPEAKYPTAIEEIYAALEWIAASGPDHDLDPGRIAVAGDSVGGNMTAAVAAGVPVTSVRYNGTIHDFVMLNALRDTRAALAATAQGGEFLRATLWDE